MMESYMKNFYEVEFIKREKGFSLRNGNKEYIYDNSIFPTDIIAEGESILNSPVKLCAFFSGKEGIIKDVTYKIMSSSDEKVSVIVSAVAENIVINELITLECDGFLKTDIKILPFWEYSENGDNIPRLDKMYLSVNVKKEAGSLFHYWPNDIQSILPAPDVMNSNAAQNGCYPFKPYVWTGNREKGLGLFFGDTFENFELLDNNECVAVKTDISSTKIQLNMLDFMPEEWQGEKDRWVKTLKPKFYTVGFQVTPVKKMPKERELLYKRFHIGCSDLTSDFYDDDKLKKIAEYGTKCIILHEDWTVIQNYGLAYDEEKLKEQIGKAHGLGMKVLLYFGYEYSSYAPDFTDKCNEYLIKTSDGKFTGGWQRKPWQRAFMVCYRGGYGNVFINRVINAMENYGADGIYTDSTYVPWECANFAHGCGYRDKKGEIHTTYNVMAVREFVKILYKEVHKRGGIIDTHQSSCCVMPTLSFADSYFDGENIQESYRKSGLDFLSLDSFCTEYMGENLGLVPNFIAYTCKELSFERASALTLLHNVHTRPFTNTKGKKWDLDKASEIWKIYDEFQLDSREFIPYYKNGELKTEDEKIFVSVYRGSENDVAVISNFNGEDKNVLITGNFKTAENIKTGEKTFFNEGKAKITVRHDMPEFFVFC